MATSGTCTFVTDGVYIMYMMQLLSDSPGMHAAQTVHVLLAMAEK